MDNAGGFWRELFSVRGRNNRARYWQVTGLYLVAMLAAGALSTLLDGEPSTAAIVLSIVLLSVLTIGGLVASFFNHVKRLHDVGLSGWWLLLGVVLMTPIELLRIADSADVKLFGETVQLVVSVGLLILFGSVPGQRRPNRFGEPPGGVRLTEPQPDVA